MLQELGYTNVAHLDGGINAWKEQGKPIEDTAG
jgi:rhodanese-related sulfurtransferase